MLFSAWQATVPGVATGAGVEVDDHAPGGPVGAVRGRIERRRDVARLEVLVAFQLALRRIFVDADLLHEGRVVVIFIERRLADEAAAFHRVVLLRGGERIGAGNFLDLDAGDEAGRGGGAQRVGVEARALGDAQRWRYDVALGLGEARRGAAVAEREGERLVMLAGRDEDGKLERAAVGRGDFDHRVRGHRVDGDGRDGCAVGRARAPVGVGQIGPAAVGRG